jgi:hypothetical protein
VVLSVSLTASPPASGRVDETLYLRTDAGVYAVPFEAVLVRAGGLFVTPDQLQFGVQTAPQQPRAIALSIINSGTASSSP